MTDEHELDESSFDDPAFDDVRALLAGARHDEPVPVDVAARLDATLSALREERVASDPDVVPLRRRRSWAPRLLAAAAVVVLVGGAAIGLSHVDGLGASDDRSPSADAGSARAGADCAGCGSGGGGTAADKDAPAAPPAAAPELSGLDPLSDGLSAAGVPRFTTARFAQQVAAYPALTNLVGAYSSTGDVPSPTTTAQRRDRIPVTKDDQSACAGPSVPGATTLPALLDGEPAALVVHPAGPDGQRVEAWSCDGSTRLASTTVPPR